MPNEKSVEAVEKLHEALDIVTDVYPPSKEVYAALGHGRWVQWALSVLAYKLHPVHPAVQPPDDPRE